MNFRHPPGAGGPSVGPYSDTDRPMPQRAIPRSMRPMPIHESSQRWRARRAGGIASGRASSRRNPRAARMSCARGGIIRRPRGSRPPPPPGSSARGWLAPTDARPFSRGRKIVRVSRTLSLVPTRRARRATARRAAWSMSVGTRAAFVGVGGRAKSSSRWSVTWAGFARRRGIANSASSSGGISSWPRPSCGPSRC